MEERSPHLCLAKAGTRGDNVDPGPFAVVIFLEKQQPKSKARAEAFSLAVAWMVNYHGLAKDCNKTPNDLL